MKFSITISCDNAAFENVYVELIYILDNVSDKLRMEISKGIIKDSNGNTVGSFELK